MENIYCFFAKLFHCHVNVTILSYRHLSVQSLLVVLTSDSAYYQ